MKKIFVIILFIFLWSNQVLVEANSERNDHIYYNEPSKRIYILGGLEENDHFEFTRHVKEGAESVFVNFPGGYHAGEIAPLIEKYKLPVFVGRHCYSACTIISTRSPTLYASADSKFMFHEGRADSLKGYNIEDYRFNRQRLNTEYRKAGATDEFIELMNSEREKDTSKYDQAWEIWLTCKELKKYFTKNQINCNSISDSEGIDFIINNHPNLKKSYCANNQEKKLIEVFFNPSCPIHYKEIGKSNFNVLEKKYFKIDENQPNLKYQHDYGKLDMLINEIGKISEAGIVFDFDEISKKHGFKSFKDAVSKYKKKFKVKIKVKQAKDYFTKVDQLIEIDYSQENLDKLYDILINNKIVRKRSTYFKEKKAFPDKALAGCIDLKKELARLTIDPNSKSPELYVWGANWNNSTPEKARAAAIYSNKIWTEKQKIPLSSCDYIIIDVNDKSFLTESYIKEYIKEKNL